MNSKAAFWAAFLLVAGIIGLTLTQVGLPPKSAPIPRSRNLEGDGRTGLEKYSASNDPHTLNIHVVRNPKFCTAPMWQFFVCKLT